jgi:oxygen-independent coproporphyrinogen-3 oxidase
VHVPFCRKRCYYCSFNTAPLEDRESVERYVRNVVSEIGLVGAAPLNERRPEIATLFFGGGTPSLLEPDELAAILDAIRDGFAVAADIEITVECNPESVTRDKLAAYRAAGINRVSLGVQSLDDSILPVLGRLHDARGARAGFVAAREAGFGNVSVDLMYGLPGLDIAGWRRGLASVLDWQPDHLSAYGLTLDAGSLWGATGAPQVPAEETTVAQYRGLCDAAGARGFEHYEISNWARPGFRSRHNQIYWRRAEYLAAGPGGCGFIGNVRYGNTKPLARYCALVEEHRLPIDTSERLTERQALGERLILGLRTVAGVPAAQLAERVAADAALARRVETWRERGLLVVADGRAWLSEEGFLLSDALFVELL